MTRRFSLTFDYLCPFARNANEHVVTALQEGADWDVTFVPYSLAQGHVGEGEPPIWEQQEPNGRPGILALRAGLVVRDRYPQHFLAAHLGLFAARHDDGEDILDPTVIAHVLKDAGVDADDVLAAAQDPASLEQLRDEHVAGVEEHGVWGVPTFITDERAVFVRVMDRPGDDAKLARRRIGHILDLVDAPLELHEFKQVDLPV